MSNLSVFVFEGQDVRLVGTPEKPEWVAQDVCDVLEIKNSRDALAEFDDDEKGVATIYTPGGNQEVLTVTEPGLYRLIFKSRKPATKRFQRWVFHEVLPSIRKTGSYSPTEAPVDTAPTPLAIDLALLRSLLQVKPIHPFVKWQGGLLASTQAIAEWLEMDSEKARGHYNRRSAEFQQLGMITRALPKTLRTKLGVSDKTNNLRLWTPRALVHLAALVTEQSPTAQKLTALTGTLPQLAALSLDDQISELYQRAVEAETVAARSGKSALVLYLELGEKLAQRKAEFKYGEWLPYLKQRGINERRSQRAIQLWEHRDEIEGALKDLTLTQALNQLGKKTIASSESEALIAVGDSELDFEQVPATVDVMPVVETPIAPIPPAPPLNALDRIQQATATATQIEALPDGSTLKLVLTGQLSRAIQLINFAEFTEAIEESKPRIEPDPITVADHAKLHGKHLSPFQIQQAGLQAAKLYRDRHGCNPPKKSVAINGTICPVNLYPATDWDLVEQAIALALES